MLWSPLDLWSFHFIILRSNPHQLYANSCHSQFGSYPSSQGGLLVYATVTGIISEQTPGRNDVYSKKGWKLSTLKIVIPMELRLCRSRSYECLVFWLSNKTYSHWVYWLFHCWTWSVSQDECCIGQDTACRMQHLESAWYPGKLGRSWISKNMVFQNN